LLEARIETDDYLHGKHAVFALAALGACAGCFITAESLPIGLLPQISASMHTSLSATGLLVTIYALVVVFATVPLTHMTSELPRRLLLSSVAGVLVIGSLGSALAPNYWALLAARIFTALAQAIFWAVGPVEAANLVRPEQRGRAVSGVFAGSAIGLVLGLPAGTWLGHVLGWRLAFVALSGAALFLLLAIVAALPNRLPTAASSDERRESSHKLYLVTVVTTGLVVAGYYSAYTYVTPFLLRVSGVSRGFVTLGGGVAATIGLVIGGPLYTRLRQTATSLAVGTMAVAMLGLFVFAKEAALAALFVALNSLGLGQFDVAAQTAVIDLGPHDGTAWFSTAFNVGIGIGPLIGGLTLSTAGLRSTALVGGLIAAAAMVLALTANRVVARTVTARSVAPDVVDAGAG
jgi:MFS transporter, DHA1 family, inner membrane transport protein